MSDEYDVPVQNREDRKLADIDPDLKEKIEEQISRFRGIDRGTLIRMGFGKQRTSIYNWTNPLKNPKASEYLFEEKYPDFNNPNNRQTITLFNQKGIEAMFIRAKRPIEEIAWYLGDDWRDRIEPDRTTPINGELLDAGSQPNRTDYASRFNTPYEMISNTHLGDEIAKAILQSPYMEKLLEDVATKAAQAAARETQQGSDQITKQMLDNQYTHMLEDRIKDLEKTVDSLNQQLAQTKNQIDIQNEPVQERGWFARLFSKK